jgi:hypothetical protein
MQKVVGSSPIIRSKKTPQKQGFCLPKRRLESGKSLGCKRFCKRLACLRRTSPDEFEWRNNRAESAKRVKEDTMKAEVGDRIVVEAEKVGQSTRTGVVEEVLTPEPPRLRVRWDDGHSTVLAPTAGAARIEPAKR